MNPFYSDQRGQGGLTESAKEEPSSPGCPSRLHAIEETSFVN